MYIEGKKQILTSQVGEREVEFGLDLTSSESEIHNTRSIGITSNLGQTALILKTESWAKRMIESSVPELREHLSHDATLVKLVQPG